MSFGGNTPIPTGTDWTGAVDGRLWTVTGDGLTIGVPPSPRAVLAGVFRTAAGAGVQVYDHPPETITPPAVVIRPADPYQAPATAGGYLSALWAFEVDIILTRNRADLSLDSLERAREQLCAVLPAGWRWVEFGELGEIDVGKKTYLKATLGVATIATEGMASYG